MNNSRHNFNSRRDFNEEPVEFESLADCQAAWVKAEREAVELKDKYLRAAAELENTRKRATREAQARALEGQHELLRQLIEVMDNLERALAAHPPDGGELARGVHLTLRQFEQVLAGAGVQRIEVEPGDPFDPNIHEAVAVRRGQVDEATVYTVERSGYRHDGLLLRPARVVVIQ